MKSGLEKIFLKLGSFHKLCLHLGVGRWSEKCVGYHIKSENYKGRTLGCCTDIDFSKYNADWPFVGGNIQN